MREAYVPYTKIVTLTGIDVVSVDLTDSEGQELACNYVQVAAAVSSVDGYFFVTPRISSAKGYANQPAASVIANDTSAALGMVSNRETGVAVLSLPPGDKTTQISISQSSAVSVKYAITYGNVKLINPVSDHSLDRGN